MNRELDRQMRAEGVSLEQWRVLRVLGGGAGYSMGELAGLVLMNHPTLTKTVDRMVSDALVYRAPDAVDRRKVLIFISERGRVLAERLGALADAHQQALLDGCSEREARQLRSLLEGLIARTG